MGILKVVEGKTLIWVYLGDPKSSYGYILGGMGEGFCDLTRTSAVANPTSHRQTLMEHKTQT